MKRRLEKEQLLEFLLNGKKAEIEEVIDTIHPADILDILHEDEEDSFLILSKLPDEMIAAVIEHEEDEEKYNIISLFSDTRQKRILAEMSSDEITDFLEELEEDEVQEILAKMNKSDQADVRKLMTFESDSAGGIMSTEFISIRANNTVEDTLHFLQKNTDEQTTYYLYVTDKQMVLKGVVSLREIVTSPFDRKVIDITNPNVISVHYNDDQEEVAHLFEKYDFIMMPVVDDDNHMLGVITFDDVMDVLQEETTEDIHHLGGVGKEEKVDSSMIESAKSRLPWLVVNLFTAVLAAMVVSTFESTISQVVSLATIMPIVTGMGGNAGTQTMTIIVRGLSLGEITKDNAVKIILKEIGVGIISGIVIGVIVAIGAMLFEGNPMFGVVTGVAMFLNMLLANIAGYAIPLVLEKIQVDPALASSVFVTTVTDVLGFFFFLGLATSFITYLL